MATPNQCPEYNKCGYVEWRTKRPYNGIEPLPKNGDCGINKDSCLRLNPDIPTIELEKKVPQTDSELRVALPEIPNKNNRPARRIIGGGHI